jgi:hypothetical protein
LKRGSVFSSLARNFKTELIFFVKKLVIMRLTMVIKQGKSGYLVGQLKEIPEVFTQGKDMKELKENILDALELYFEDL